MVWKQCSETKAEIGRDILGRVFSADGKALSGVFEIGTDRFGIDATGSMAGLDGNDAITGNGRANALFGDAGDDRLSAGAGADRVVFDTIAAFTGDNRIPLDNADFRGIGGRGELDARAFKVLGQGVDPSDRILYDRRDGILHHDPDGSGAAARVAFAKIDGSPRLTHDDVQII